jgi:hypothetical protein
MVRVARLTGTRHNDHAVGIMAKIHDNAPEKELGKAVYVPVTKNHLPELRALVAYLEAQDDC